MGLEVAVLMKPHDSMKRELPLRVTVVGLPPGVTWRLQRGGRDLIPPSRADGAGVSFDLTVRVGGALPDGRPNLLGPLTQGPPGGRFLYVNSGTLAGQADSPWTRRAKVPLGGITQAMVGEVLARPGVVLEARIAGTAKDGGPACATVPLLGAGWGVVPIC
jgi:hypothetical protein